MTQPAPRKNFIEMLLISIWEAFFVSTFQAIEWGITWGGAISIGLALVLTVFSYFFPWIFSLG